MEALERASSSSEAPEPHGTHASLNVARPDAFWQKSDRSSLSQCVQSCQRPAAASAGPDRALRPQAAESN